MNEKRLKKLNHTGTENTEKTNTQLSYLFLLLFSVFSVPLWFNFFLDAAQPRCAPAVQILLRLFYTSSHSFSALEKDGSLDYVIFWQIVGRGPVEHASSHFSCLPTVDGRQLAARR